MAISKIKTGSIDTAYTTAITTNPQFSGTESVKFPGGSTAQRPASAVIGQMRYNSDSGYFETYTAAGWGSIATPPSITTVSPTTFNGETSTLFTINGSFFDPSATVKFITTSGVEHTAAAVSYNNTGQLTATTPRDFTVADEPLSVKVINGSGLAFVLSSCIDCGGVPAWSTAAGSLASVAGGSSVNTSVTAVDPDSNATVSYSLSSGALPSGVSLNTSTGAITGSVSNLSAATASTTSNFTLVATDNAGNSTSRNFSITVTNNPPTWSTASGSLGSVLQGSSGSFTVEATDPEGGAVTYSVTSGSLPTGMTLNSSTGVISGTPSGYSSSSNTVSFSITATDAANQTTARSFSIGVTVITAVAFSYTGGNQSFVVPAGVTSVAVYAWGAGGSGGGSGGEYSGGSGGYISGTLATTPGETLTIIVGQGGRNQTSDYRPLDRNYAFGGGASGGGGNQYAYAYGSGGGRTAIRRGSTELATAGGGGGAGYGGNGGAGGGSSGVAGTGGGGSGSAGGGATQSAGGSAGSNGGEFGVAGIQFAGGYSGESPGGAEGGGGGGGYYGGGGGGDNTGGGGGSGYVGGLTNAVNSVGDSKTTDGASSGSYNPPATNSQYYSAGVGVGPRGPNNGGAGKLVIVY